MFNRTNLCSRRLGFVLFAFWIIIGLLVWPASAWAHPLGNFSINRYSRLELGAEQLHLYYILDMAEIPTFQAQERLDLNQDGAISPSERVQYLADQVEMWQNNLILQSNGARLALSPVDQALTFSEGQGGLNTLRLSAHFVADLPSGMTLWSGSYDDNNYPDRLGWQEVIVLPKPGVTLLETTASTKDVSQELRHYPQDLLQNPLRVRQATFRFERDLAPVDVSGVSAPPVETASLQPNRAEDPFAALITVPLLGPGALLVALLVAFGWGAAHALTPGHGKTIVAAYLVGSRGTIRHAIFLGLTTTLTHTAGVFVLGLLTLFAAQFILPEQLYPWLGVASGLLVVGIGLSLARGHWAGFFKGTVPHAHHHPDRPDHNHTHSHSSHTHHHSLFHDGETPVTWRSLLALGISGGLIPCPSALVVMLSAIALQRIGFGLILIVTFSLGLAGVLTAIGVMWVQAGRWLDKFSQQGRLLEAFPGYGYWLRALPVASALFISLLGAGVTFQALAQTGILDLS